MKVTATYDADRKVLSITYHGETREFPAHGGPRDSDGGYVYAYNVFSTKFKTGEKLWPAGVTYWFRSGNLNIEQGGYQNRGGARTVVGWWKHDQANNTRFNGRR